MVRVESLGETATLSVETRRYLLSEVPSGSLPALLATGTALALLRLVLPAVHWLDDTRPFGILRPRSAGNAGGP